MSRKPGVGSRAAPQCRTGNGQILFGIKPILQVVSPGDAGELSNGVEISINKREEIGSNPSPFAIDLFIRRAQLAH